MATPGGQCVRAEFGAEPRSPYAARRLLRETLHGWQLGHLEDVATLLVSELATNAVMHAQSGFLVEAVRRPSVVRVSLYDCGTAEPTRRHDGLHAGSGRGIGLVAVLASAWGTSSETAPWAKVVWFELPVDPAALPEPAEGALLARWPA